MPIKPENKKRYPKNWKTISAYIRLERAGGRCEFIINGERCAAEQGKPHPITGSKVILTVAHLDHQPENCDFSNLLAGCQRCHLIYDIEHHQRTRLQSLRCSSTIDLFENPTPQNHAENT